MNKILIFIKRISLLIFPFNLSHIKTGNRYIFDNFTTIIERKGSITDNYEFTYISEIFN